MKAENRKREVSATTSPKVRARQSRFYKDRETSAVLRIDDSAVLCPNIGAEYQRPSAFFFLQTVRHYAIPPFSAVATNTPLCWKSLRMPKRNEKALSAELRAVSFLHGRWRADEDGILCREGGLLLTVCVCKDKENA